MASSFINHTRLVFPHLATYLDGGLPNLNRLDIAFWSSRAELANIGSLVENHVDKPTAIHTIEPQNLRNAWETPGRVAITLPGNDTDQLTTRLFVETSRLAKPAEDRNGDTFIKPTQIPRLHSAVVRCGVVANLVVTDKPTTNINAYISTIGGPGEDTLPGLDGIRDDPDRQPTVTAHRANFISTINSLYHFPVGFALPSPEQ